MQVTEQDGLIERTIKKMERSQQKKKEILAYIEQHHPDLLDNTARNIRVRNCCNMLRFAKVWEQTKLVEANFCKYDKFCLACATRRAIKKIQHFTQWIYEHWLETKNWYHITLTIRHSKEDTLEELLDKLMKCKKTLTQRVRNSKRTNQNKQSFFSQFDGSVSSIEVTYSQKSWRHPHIHILACSDNDILIEYSPRLWTESNGQLQKERYSITKDSYSVAMRKVDISKGYFDRQGIAEVFKYAVKFTTLSIPKLVELVALQQKKNYRFYASTWIFRWWKIDVKNVFQSKTTKRLLYNKGTQSYSIQNQQKNSLNNPLSNRGLTTTVLQQG